jgi:hypothetical protein
MEEALTIEGDEAATRRSLLTRLLCRQEFDLVLEFCSFRDVFCLGLSSHALERRYEGPLDTMAENLIGAAMRNDLASVDCLLLVHGVPASIVRGSLWDGFMTPLIAAAMRGNHKVVEKLLHAGAEVNTCHCSTSEYCSVDQGYITMT